MSQITEKKLSAQLANDLKESSDLALVVSSHLHVEYWVDRLIAFHFPNRNKLKKLRLNYSRKIQLLAALGVKEEELKPLRYLGQLRNRFAHDIGYILEESKVSEFYEEFSAQNRDQLLVSTQYLFPEISIPTFEDLGHKDKYRIMLASLCTAIRLAVTRLENEKNA